MKSTIFKLPILQDSLVLKEHNKNIPIEELDEDTFIEYAEETHKQFIGYYYSKRFAFINKDSKIGLSLLNK